MHKRNFVCLKLDLQETNPGNGTLQIAPSNSHWSHLTGTTWYTIATDLRSYLSVHPEGFIPSFQLPKRVEMAGDVAFRNVDAFKTPGVSLWGGFRELTGKAS